MFLMGAGFFSKRGVSVAYGLATITPPIIPAFVSTNGQNAMLMKAQVHGRCCVRIMTSKEYIRGHLELTVAIWWLCTDFCLVRYCEAVDMYNNILSAKETDLVSKGIPTLKFVQQTQPIQVSERIYLRFARWNLPYAWALVS